MQMLSQQRARSWPDRRDRSHDVPTRTRGSAEAKPGNSFASRPNRANAALRTGPQAGGHDTVQLRDGSWVCQRCGTAWSKQGMYRRYKSSNCPGELWRDVPQPNRRDERVKEQCISRWRCAASAHGMELNWLPHALEKKRRYLVLPDLWPPFT